MSLEECAQTYLRFKRSQREMIDAQRGLELTDSERDEQYQVLRGVYIAKLEYVRTFHGPHFDELMRLFQQAGQEYHAFFRILEQLDDKTQDQLDTLEGLRLLKNNAEHQVFACVEPLDSLEESNS